MIALIGMPGGGKSTVGRHLARGLDLEFSDTDALIEARLGCPIRTFFEEQGESRFRDIEAAVLDEALAVEIPGVLATGGGIVLRDANRRSLRASSLCVYLRSTPEELFRRLKHDVKRPLLQVLDPLARLRELHAERDPLYCETAHLVVETGRPSIPAVVETIVTRLGLSGTKPGGSHSA